MSSNFMTDSYSMCVSILQHSALADCDIHMSGDLTASSINCCDCNAKLRRGPRFSLGATSAKWATNGSRAMRREENEKWHQTEWIFERTAIATKRLISKKEEIQPEDFTPDNAVNGHCKQPILSRLHIFCNDYVTHNFALIVAKRYLKTTFHWSRNIDKRWNCGFFRVKKSR